MLPIEVVNVIDAECMVLASQGQPIDRTALIKRILGEWAVQRHRAASVVLRVAGANPISLDSE